LSLTQKHNGEESTKNSTVQTTRQEYSDMYAEANSLQHCSSESTVSLSLATEQHYNAQSEETVERLIRLSTALSSSSSVAAAAAAVLPPSWVDSKAQSIPHDHNDN
jgi:hypothetical protein